MDSDVEDNDYKLIGTIDLESTQLGYKESLVEIKESDLIEKEFNLVTFKDTTFEVPPQFKSVFMLESGRIIACDSVPDLINNGWIASNRPEAQIELGHYLGDTSDWRQSVVIIKGEND